MVYQHPQLVKDPLVLNDFPLWLRPSLFCVLQVSVIDIEKEIKFRKIMKIIVLFIFVKSSLCLYMGYNHKNLQKFRNFMALTI